MINGLVSQSLDTGRGVGVLASVYSVLVSG